MITQALKSKTISANLALPPIAIVLVWVAGLYGVEIPPEVAVALTSIVMGAVNVVLRTITTTAIKDK